MKDKINIDIGITPVREPYKLVEIEDIKKYFPNRLNYSNKSSYGYVAIVGGCKKYSGAIRLANMAAAAMRTGCGICNLAVPNCIASDIRPYLLESTMLPLKDEDGYVAFEKEEIDSLISRNDVIAFGMGIGLCDGATRILEYLLKKFSGTLIVDADGLSALSKISEDIIISSEAKLILTPHIKEFSRIANLNISQINMDPISCVINVAQKFNGIVLLKGPTTIVSDGKSVNLVQTGAPGMATAGSGDVLSGILAATCGYIDDAFASTTAAAYINGLAGQLADKEIGSYSQIASDTVQNIALALTKILK